MSECTCPDDVATLMRTRLNGTADHCPTHDPTPPQADPAATPLALNGDGLETSLRSKLGMTLTETTTPLDAA